MTSKSVSSKGEQDRGTPKSFIEKVNNLYPLIFDLAASKQNSKCGKNFFSIKENSLNQDWAQLYSQMGGKGFFWLNPPFCAPTRKCEKDCKKKKCIERGFHNEIDQPGISAWMEKCVLESKNGAKIATLTLATRGTVWYRKWVRPNALSLILGKRIIFEGETTPFTRELMLNIFGTGMTGEGYLDI